MASVYTSFGMGNALKYYRQERGGRGTVSKRNDGCGYEHKATVSIQRLLSHGEITLSSGAAGVSELTVRGLTHTQASLIHHSPQVIANPSVIRLG